jgi:hypothetical protein
MIDIPGPIAKSEFRKEIDDMLGNGDTYVAISNWLKNNGENISRDTISKYARFCFNVNAAVVQKYTQEDSDARLEQLAEEGALTLKLYDKFIKAAYEIDPSLLDPKTIVEIGTKHAKQREDFLAEHGDREAELQSQLLREIRDELVKQDLTEMMKGISDERTKQRLSKATDST